MKRLTSLGLSLALAAGLFAGQASAATYETEVLSGVNLRSAPNTNASVYRLLSKGEDIHVIEKVNDYWLKVQTKDGRIGYISASSKYTNYIKGSSGKTATATSGVNLRSAPSTNGSKIGFIGKGQTVTVLEQVNAYWLKVNYNGTVGYASAGYFNYSSSSGSNSGTKNATGSAIVKTAKSYLGKFTYKWGAEPWNTNNKYSDCSAFVQLVYNRNHGFKLPRTSKDQSKQGKYVSKSNLAPGDLVFFDTDDNGSINHVGIYIGGGDFIHSSPTNKVGINTLNSGYWKSKYKTARRVL